MIVSVLFVTVLLLLRMENGWIWVSVFFFFPFFNIFTKNKRSYDSQHNLTQPLEYLQHNFDF